MTISRMPEWGLSLVLLLVLAASACGSSGTTVDDATPTEAYAPAIDPSDFTGQITNQYFPLTPGTTYVYEGTADGVAEHNEVTVTHDTKVILGVTCVVVHDVVTTADGEVTEDTLDWYAQDSEGNVWYFGEDTKEYENGEVSSTAGSWEAGVDGARPGIVMKASPAVGDSYRQEYYAGEAEDMAKVIQVGAAAEVTAGSYQNVLVTEESTPLSPDQVEHKYYAPGVGFVKSSLVQGGSEETQLVRIDTE
jgi:hypothetical protein